MMEKKNSQSNNRNDKKLIVLKNTYGKPELKKYGHVGDLTQSTGSQNGDGGQNMMIK